MKKIVIMLVLDVVFGGVSFTTVSKNDGDKPKYITIGGNKYQYVIGTASKGGTYYPAGEKLTNQLNEAVVAETDGSMQNMDLLRMENGGINIGIVQADIASYECTNNPSSCRDLKVIKTNKYEYPVIVCRNDIKSLQQKTPLKIDVGALSSGGSGSLDNITRLEPDYNSYSFKCI